MGFSTRAGAVNVAGALLLIAALPAIYLYLTPGAMAETAPDSFVYLGYTINLRSLVERYDVTYYMLRMAVIGPGRFVYHIFGPQNGFFALEYLKILVGAACAFLVALRFYGSSVAWFCSVFVCFSPWYARSSAWNYVDGFALSYLLAAFACVLVPRKRLEFWYAFAGLCVALATNSNLYAIAIWLGFLPSWIVFNRKRSWRLLLQSASTFCVGFIVGYGILASVVNNVRPGLGMFFERYTLDVAGALLRGGTAKWFEPLGPFLAEGNYYILAPAAIIIGGFLFLLRFRSASKDTPIAPFTLYLGVIIAVYLVNHYVFHSARITSIDYFCYLFIPSLFVLMAIVGEIASVSGKIGWLILLLADVALVLLWKIYAISDIYRDIPYAAFIALVGALFVGSGLVLRYKTAALTLVLAFAIGLPGLFLRTSERYAVLEQHHLEKADVYSGLLHLITTVETYAPPSSGPGRFWYADKPGAHRWLLDVQSAYLDEYSRLATRPPAVNEGLLSELRSGRKLVILGLTPAEVNQDLMALERAGVRSRWLVASTFHGRSWGYAYLVARLMPPEPVHGKLLVSVTLASLKPATDMVLPPTTDAEGLHFETDPRRWAYSLQSDISARLAGKREKVTVCTKTKVVSGIVGVAVTPAKSTSNFLSEAEIDSDSEFDEVCLPPEPANDVGYLIFRNRFSRGPSKVIIESVDIYSSATKKM